MAPEVIKKSYNEKCDIWSIGIIFYLLLTNKRAYEGENTNSLFLNIISKDYDQASTNFQF